MRTAIISKPAIIVAAILMLTIGAGIYVWHESHRAPLLEVYIFSLKSGRSIFIRTPDDHRILVDGGGDNEVIRDISGILPFYSHHIDALISTGADGKNVVGLTDVLGRYSVDQAYIPGVTLASLGLSTSSDPVYSSFIDALDLKKIPVHEVIAGDVISFGQEVEAQALFPASLTDFQYSKASAPEMILRISYASTSAVLLGGATKKVQKFVASESSTTADLVYVSHSISLNDIAAELTAVLQPKFLIYSQVVRASSAKAKPSKVASSATASSTSKKKAPVKIPVDPLASIPADGLVNLKEQGTVHLVSDGTNFSLVK